MKKIFFIIFCVCTLLLTACGKKTTQEFIGDNMNTPFIELSPELQKKVEDAFKSVEISSGYSKKGEQYTNYTIEERKKYSSVNWQENQTKKNIDDYHYWFTCYYERDEMVVFHVERTLKGLEGGQKMVGMQEYDISDYVFRIYGGTLQNYTYILVYKNGSLYELKSAYDKYIINDNDVKGIYKHYIDSRFLKYQIEDLYKKSKTEIDN